MSEHTSPADPKPPAEDRLSLLWRRISDHRLVQWSVTYVALAYGIQHGVTLTSEAFDWPHAVERVSMLLLVLGLPVVMTLGWYHGARASRRISGPELSIISILLVIGAGLFYVFARPAEEIAAGPAPAVKTQAASIAGAPGSTTAAGISIAVLPFANLSGDASQEFFSDGMTEEITSALAKVPDLQVVARSSAFQFKGQQKDMRAVGQALGARYLIDGSVRKAGNRVRIAAQLIRSDSGVNVWNDTYDRELTDVFATQEDIAVAIAGALKLPLGLQQGDTLVRGRTKDLESYDQYLRAKVLLRARGTDLVQAIAILEQVVARDPAFAPAWGLLAQAYVSLPSYSAERRSDSPEVVRRFLQSSDDKAERAAREAVRLDSRNVLSYSVLARLQSHRGKFAAAEDLYKQALALDPAEPDALYNLSVTLWDAGRLKDALGVIEKLRRLEPFVPVFDLSAASLMVVSGQIQAAIPIFKSIPPEAAGGFFRGSMLAQAYAAQGRYAEAADSLLLISGNVVSRRSVEDAARLLRSAPTKVKASESLPALEGQLNFVYAYVGAQDRLLEYPERMREFGVGGTLNVIWTPAYAPARKTERFKVYARAAGLVDYWKARGWSDLCHPVGTDDFACD